MSNAPVDLRSDTVTRPTAAMRKAMAEAEVGDDVYGEDPTVNRLQETYAEMVGMAAALYVPSGTMANQIALRLLAPAGTAVIAGARQHIVIYEGGAAGLNSGAQIIGVDDDDGTISADAVEFHRAATAHHYIAPSLICIENTHLPSGGRWWPLDDLDALSAAAGPLPIHMDGARLFNVCVASGIAARQFTSYATTVMSCLSKGLERARRLAAGRTGRCDRAGARRTPASRRRHAPGWRHRRRRAGRARANGRAPRGGPRARRQARGRRRRTMAGLV